MTSAYYCVLIAGLLPYVFTILAKSGKGFDNHAPRKYLANLSGWRARANWAQQNSFEIFPFFASGIIIAGILGKNPSMVRELAIAFIISRLIYGLCYILDYALLRSLVWLVGIIIIVSLYSIA